MLKTLNMALFRCPVGFSKEIISVFQIKESKLTPKMTKIPRLSIFQSFYAFSVNLLRLHGLECFEGSTRRRFGCPVVVFEEFCAFFKMENISENDNTENDKNPKIFHFSKILSIFSKFSTDFVNWNIEKGQQGKNVLSSRLGFSEEFVAVF